MSVRRGFLFALALVLSACATAPRQMPPDVPTELLWQQRTAQLQALDTWSFNGRAAVSGEGIDSRSVRAHWSMDGDRYELAFLSVLGQRLAELSGGDAGASLRLPGEEPRFAATPEALLAATLGWAAPVRSLRYWVLGLPMPDASAPVQLDPLGRLARLEQEGWQVVFDRYAAVGGLDLPRRLTLTHPQLRIRLLIDEWDLAHAGR